MYKINTQITLAEFQSPFGELDKENRWVKIADMLPWSRFEKKYAKQFSEDNGAPAIQFRMALGTLLIKQKTGHSDEEVLQDILENPYMQFLIGLHEFTKIPPFSASSITNFRKYIPAEMINEINDHLFRSNHPSETDEEDNPNDDDDNKPSAEDAPNDSNNDTPQPPPDPKNQGTLLLDATCAPADIAYPTDVNLLNEAREKLEAMIDTLQPKGYALPKPRTYRYSARKDYLRFIKMKKPGQDNVRKAIKKQLSYVARDIKHVNSMLQSITTTHLSNHQEQWLSTIRELYIQQFSMYETQTHSVPKRIVSISQPHVRAIKRGKHNAPYEFGAKISASLTNGYAFIDRLSWDAYNEEIDLIPAVEAYKKYNGYYPARVLADQIYRNKTNRDYCRERGIRLSGPALGRPPKEPNKELMNQQRRDAADRSPVEGKFGEGKNKYGLNRVMARIKESSETVIAISFLCMNISRRLRVLLRFFRFFLVYAVFSVDIFFKKIVFLKFGVFA